jgi:hypothetical protein
MRKNIITIFVMVLLIVSITTVVQASQNIKEKKQGHKLLFTEILSEDSSVNLKVHKEESSKEIEADLLFNPKTLDMDKLLKYKSEMPNYFDKVKKMDIESIPVTVTFNSPISFEELSNITSSYSVEVNRVFVETVTDDGSVGGATVEVEKGDDTPQQKVENILNGPVNISIVGVYAFEGTISSLDDTFGNLSKNEDVFIVDVTKAYIDKKVKASKDYKNLKEKDSKIHVDVNVYDVYWELEKVKRP